MNRIAIVDLGGQYCHLIARRLRDLGIESDVVAASVSPEKVADYAGIILSGGPRSVYDPTAPRVHARIFELGQPILGICYGHQLLAQSLGGEVSRGQGEYGLSRLELLESDTIFVDTPKRQKVWMSHSDAVRRLPRGATRLARTKDCAIAAFADVDRRMFGVQFHPEVVHSDYGSRVLDNFVSRVCGITDRCEKANRVDRLSDQIRSVVGDRSVFFLVSGGVDSTVAFTLCGRALPRERVLGVYVDTGLMRAGETDDLMQSLHEIGLSDRIHILPKGEQFLRELEGQTEPERKREIIGKVFVNVQAEAMKAFGINEDAWMLGQGTIYPDTIESGGTAGTAAVIKTHHNRCQEILDLIAQGRVIEPLREFYKDEVREIGADLGLSEGLTNRWPFPGPGLAIRCLSTETLQRAEDMGSEDGYEAVRLPLKTVGVQGDERTYSRIVAVSGDCDYERLEELSSSLCNMSTLQNRVIYLLAARARLKEATVRPKSLQRDRIALLRLADDIARRTMQEHGLMETVWQFPVVLIPVSFGTEEGETIVLRPVNSVDGMTANFARVPEQVLREMTDHIMKLSGIDAVFLDVTNKPPATIEWE